MRSHMSTVQAGDSGTMFKIVWEYLHKTYPEIDFHYQQTYSLVNKFVVQQFNTMVYDPSEKKKRPKKKPTSPQNAKPHTEKK